MYCPNNNNPILLIFFEVAGLLLVFFVNVFRRTLSVPSTELVKLCGGYRENYSLAIGSFHCMYCPNNNNPIFLIFFEVAGLLLVFFGQCLAVTQSMINGLIFYANIVLAHQGLLFPQQTDINANISLLDIRKTFMTWLNLDSGIQSCFFNDIIITAFCKTWLQ